MYELLRGQAESAAAELLETAKLKSGDLFVVGCSSSEIVGGTIGKNSNLDAAEAVFDGIYSVLKKSGVYICAQCCEHLNRAVIMEREAAEKYGYIPVLLPVHYSKDISILTHISKLLTCKHVLIDKTLPHRQTLGILNKCDVTIMERLHAVIFSCIYSKPFLAVNYDPKVLSFCIEKGKEDYVIALASFDKKKISKQFDLLMQNKSQLQKTLSEKAAAKQMLAQLNAECAYTLLKLR